MREAHGLFFESEDVSSTRSSVLLEVAGIKHAGELVDVLISRGLPFQGHKHLLGKARLVLDERIEFLLDRMGAMSDEIWIRGRVLHGLHHACRSLVGSRLVAVEGLGGRLLRGLLVERPNDLLEEVVLVRILFHWSSVRLPLLVHDGSISSG